MTKRNPSIEDIAKAAGVANSTVSRALRNSPLISEPVRERIQEIARTLGYTPNAIAQSLQNKRTNTIGFVVTTIADPFFSGITQGIEELARPASLSVLLSASYNDATQEAAVIETFHRRRVDGIIIASSRVNHTSLAYFERIELPIVLINNDADHTLGFVHSISIDNYTGAQIATNHLIDLGHSAIGYLGAGNRPSPNRYRYEGYCNAMRSAGLVLDERLVAIAPAGDAPYEDDVNAGRLLLGSLLDAGATAVFCFNDMMAVGVLLACQERGLRVPEDVSIVGFDDIDLARYVSPALTTIHQPRFDLGRQGLEMLLRAIENQPVFDSTLAPHLIARGSTGPRPDP